MARIRSKIGESKVEKKEDPFTAEDPEHIHKIM